MKDRPGLLCITKLLVSYSHWGLFPSVHRYTFVGRPWFKGDPIEVERLTFEEDFE